ncbi:hypothetical protein CVV38_03710 [Candidatus Peregrinibacteria bacterium HGW-Peregrinibacteria-1]|jgi:hypothetical protein|nr:MAG: hypothetical protein CVV38_03710 [Candidatus Peregrinibacteria bacterium HGW-Peregrinibacteria-1]
MVNKKISAYVQKSLAGGYNPEQISAALSDQGWSSTEINEALLKAQETIQQKSPESVAPPAPPKTSAYNIDIKSLSASQILLYLGALIVILAGIIYISINWSQWGSTARILAIALPLLTCYGAGISMFFGSQHKQQGGVFLVVGALLFPLFLSVLFKELEIFDKSFNDDFNLTISLLSFALYFASSFIFRLPIWSFLYLTVGMFVYYFTLKVIGIQSITEDPLMAWLLLIPSTAYLLSSWLYDKADHKDAGYHSYLVGALFILIPLVKLFLEAITYNKSHFAWILLVLGIAYFIFGILYEKKEFKKYCRAPYLIGAVLIFLSLLRLAIDGTLLEGFTDSKYEKYDDGVNIIGWSNVIVGVIYLTIGHVAEKMGNFQLHEARKYKGFFNLVGPLWTLGAIYFLGLFGQKPAYETLLLIASLAFIFGSIPKMSRPYLITGTFFLIVYIFSIGGEYFQNQVGWPITLFLAGLASMGTSIAVEKIRRKYFTVTKT